MKRTTLLSATLIVFALPLAAQDGTGWVPGENFINSWDYDGDGTVTLDEVLERRGDLFATFDADEDGRLTPDEFAEHDQMRGAMWDTRDGAREQAGMVRQAGRGQGQGRGGMPMGGQQAWQPMGQQGYGCALHPAMGMMPARGAGWAPQGMGPGYGYGPQTMGQGRGPGWGQGWEQGPRMMAPGWGYGPQGMGPGYGQMPQPMGPRGMAGQDRSGSFAPGMQGAPRGAGPQTGGGFAPVGGEFAMLDADGDGAVSTEEFVAVGEDWFARFDRDGDGTVTVEDFGPARR